MRPLRGMGSSDVRKRGRVKSDDWTIPASQIPKSEILSWTSRNAALCAGPCASQSNLRLRISGFEMQESSNRPISNFPEKLPEVRFPQGDNSYRLVSFAGLQGDGVFRPPLRSSWLSYGNVYRQSCRDGILIPIHLRV
jgi:hypothetical protein